jgi:uncharacterized membrane protein
MPRGSTRALPWILAIAAMGWVAVMWETPVWVNMTDRPALSRAGMMAYAVGARLCHQRPERSFRRHGQSWPVCGRCAGLYLGGALGLLVAAISAPGLSTGRRYRLMAAAAAAPTVVTAAIEWSGMSAGILARGIAAFPAGALAGWMLNAAAHVLSADFTAWRAPSRATFGAAGATTDGRGDPRSQTMGTDASG